MNAKCLAALLLCVPFALALADDAPKPSAEATAAAEDKARYVKILTQAYSLADAGKEHKSPLMLVTAGGLFLKLEGTESALSAPKQEPTEELDKDAPKPGPAQQPKDAFDFARSAEEMFDAAEAMADKANAAAVRATIKAVRADKDSSLVWDKDRGCANGPQAIARTLPAGATHSYRLPFVGGLPASVGFRSALPCQFTVVRAGNDEVLAAGVVSVGLRTWIPPASARPVVVTVRVKNLTARPVPYQLLTN